MKVVFCTPTVTRPYKQYLESLEASLPPIVAAGWDEGSVFEVGNPYISAARASMLRKALDAKADVIVFIDHDLSWDANDLLKLIETPGDVVAGTYRFKKDEVEYMGQVFTDPWDVPRSRMDGCIKASKVPAGFLKVTKEGVAKFMRAYPELTYGPAYGLAVDLFNHGAYEGVWYGEDYAFSRNWIEKCGDIWIVPDLNIDHHSPDKSYRGNYHQFLLAQPGGSEATT